MIFDGREASGKELQRSRLHIRYRIRAGRLGHAVEWVS